MQRRFGFYLALSAAVLLLVFALAYRTSVRHEFSGAAIVDKGGRAAAVTLPKLPFWMTSRTDYPSGFASRARLFEDGVALRKPHALHPEITEHGGGRYSHWLDTESRTEYVLFSASDETRPSSNGRTYAVVRPLSTSRLGLLVAALPLSIVLLFGLRRRDTVLRRDWARVSTPLVERIGRERASRIAASLLGGTYASEVSTRRTAFGLAAGAAAGALYYLYHATQGGNLGLSLGSVFQVSDAKDYWTCANTLIDDGVTSSWCHRRPLATYFFAGVGILSGRELVGVLTLAAALIGAACFFFAKELARWLGWIAAVAAVLIIVAFAQNFALGQTMSEAPGLLIGLVAAGVLLRAGERVSPWLACIGVGLFALGEMVRPGALFAIPALILWTGLLGARNIFKFAAWSAAAGLAVAAAMALHAMAGAAIGGDPSVSNANFAQTVYGLSVGDEWSALQSAHPELVQETRENVREIYRLAIENIQHDPQTFTKAVLFNAQIYLYAPWYVGALPRGHLYVVLATFLAAAALSLKSARARLLFLAAAGEFFSSLLLARDGHPRVWAVSGALTQAALPVLFAAILARPFLSLRFPGVWRTHPNAVTRSAIGRGFLAPVAAVVTLIAIPATPLRLLAANRTAAPHDACAKGAEQVVINFSAANEMRLVTGSEPDLSPWTTDRTQVVPEDRPTNWITEGVATLPDGVYIGAVTIGPGFGSYAGAYAPVSLRLPKGGEAALCLDPRDVRKIADWPFMRILSVEPLR